MRSLRPTSVLILIVCTIWMLGLFAQVHAAQTSTTANQVIVNMSQVDEKNGSQNLSLLYTITDVNGQPASNMPVDQATITVNNVVYPATVEAPRSPLSLALLFDTSGSMLPAGTTLRTAANDAISKAAIGTIFSVYTFNEHITQLLMATADANAAHNAVSKITGFSGGTCIYDAVDQAMTALRSTNPTGRNAVLLFTDGKDELANGSVCSKTPIDELITHANQQPGTIPIFTIGLRGGQPIAEGPLTTLSSATHGLLAFGSLDKLDSMFQGMISALNSQQVAQAAICVPKGKQQAILSLTSGGQQLVNVATFQTTNACTSAPAGTTAPLALSLSAFQFSPQDEALTFQVLRQGGGVISKYHVQIRYKTNIQVAGSYGDFIADPNGPITISTQGIRSETLVVSVQALGPDNVPIGAIISSEVVLERPTAVPTTILAVPVLSSFQVDLASQTLIFNISKPTNNAVIRYRVHLRYKSTNIQIAGQYGDFVIEVMDQVKIPISGIQDGDLLISVQPLNNNNQPLGDPGEQGVLLQRPTATPLPPVAFSIATVDTDSKNQQLVVKLLMDNTVAITGYLVSIVDKNGIEIYSQPYTGLPASALYIPDQNLAAGDYTLRVDLTITGQVQHVIATHSITYVPPTKQLFDSPLFLILLLVIMVIIAGLIIYLVTKILPKQPGPRGNQPVLQNQPHSSDTIDLDVLPLDRPPAKLKITRSVAQMPQTEYVIDHIPFVIGRLSESNQQVHLNFGNELTISKNHMSISYDPANHCYFLTDTSRNGILVNGKKILPQEPYPLPSDVDVDITLSNQIGLSFRSTSLVEPVSAPAGTPDSPIPDKSPGPTLPPDGSLPNQAASLFETNGLPAVSIESTSNPDGTFVDLDVTFINDSADSGSAPMLLPAHVSAILIIQRAKDVEPGTTITVDKSVWTVGRDTGPNDTKLSARDISKNQFLFKFNFASNRFGILDCKSANGTLLNGIRLNPDDICWLDPDRLYDIKLGINQDTYLIFRYRLTTT